MFLHWAIAVAIVINWLIPQITDLIPHHSVPVAIGLHRSIGISVFLLVLLRAIWRFISPPPPLPNGTAQLVRWAAHAGHGALYLLMLAVPLFGICFTWAAGRDLSFWGLVSVPAPFAPDDALKSRLMDLHGIAANTLLILACLHALAALIHQYVFKDGLLNRMLPARFRTRYQREIPI